MKLMFKHLDFDVDIELPFKEVREAFLNRWVQPLAILDVDLERFALAHVLPQLRVVARKDKFHEL